MEEIIVVGGLGRSGSSLTMRMLHKGGMEVLTDNHASYEVERASDITTRDTWLGEAKGKAIKILDLQRQNLPTEFSYKVIWLRRDFVQQAKSHIKFLQHVCQVSIQSRDWKKFERSLKRDEELAFVKLRRWSIPNIIIDFEEIIEKPQEAALKMREFLKIDLDIKKMTEIIIKRPVTCLVDMKIEEHLVQSIQKLI